MKAYCGYYVIVYEVFTPGVLGPAPGWNMPPGVRGLGERYGWTYTLISASTGQFQVYGWVYPTEAEARKAADAHKRHLKRLDAEHKKRCEVRRRNAAARAGGVRGTS